jgi:serine/threonine-protein kinase ULK/ATG1
MEKKFKRVGNYIIDTSCPIGKGSFGIVYLGCNATTSAKVAVKVLDQTSINSSPKSNKIIESISREVIILQSINHPNIVRLLDQYITTNNYYLIFEYCGDGDLASYRIKNTNNGFLSEREAVMFFNNILSGNHKKPHFF